jgi:hypothetical protein
MTTGPLDEWSQHLGTELFTSDWLTLDAGRLEAFRSSALLGPGDIPTLPSMPGDDDPVDGTYLLALVLHFKHNNNPVRVDGYYGLNYGYDRVRFIAPVQVGQRVRLRSTVTRVTERGAGGVLVRTANVMEVDEAARPAMQVDALSLYLPQAGQQAGQQAE